MNKKRCKALLGLVQLLPAVAAAAAVLFALPRTVPVLAAVPERLTTVVEQPVEAQSWEVDAVSGATYSSTGILNAVKLVLAKALLFSLLGCWLSFCRFI